MEKLKSTEELAKLREAAQKKLRDHVKTGTRIIIGMATCGIAAGAGIANGATAAGAAATGATATTG